jgi:cell division transport system permease protein
VTRRFARDRIAPRETGAAALDTVIGIMAFLAALALGALLLAERAAEGWREGLTGRLTVQVLPPEEGAIAARLTAETDAAAAILRGTDGIVGVRPLSQGDTQALVEPWIGGGAAVADLPLPRLIDATILPGARIDIAALGARLKAAAPDSVLDDHSRWIGRLRGLADGIVLSAAFILAMIAVATAAAVAFATRAGLVAHHDIVALMHQMGAHAGFIARAFEWNYLISTLTSASTGALGAAVVFAVAGSLERAGIEPAPFLPPLALHMGELPWLVLIPLAASAIAWTTARLSVLAAVARIY